MSLTHDQDGYPLCLDHAPFDTPYGQPPAQCEKPLGHAGQHANIDSNPIWTWGDTSLIDTNPVPRCSATTPGKVSPGSEHASIFQFQCVNHQGHSGPHRVNPNGDGITFYEWQGEMDLERVFANADARAEQGDESARDAAFNLAATDAPDFAAAMVAEDVAQGPDGQPEPDGWQPDVVSTSALSAQDSGIALIPLVMQAIEVDLQRKQEMLKTANAVYWRLATVLGWTDGSTQIDVDPLDVVTAIESTIANLKADNDRLVHHVERNEDGWHVPQCGATTVRSLAGGPLTSTLYCIRNTGHQGKHRAVIAGGQVVKWM